MFDFQKILANKVIHGISIYDNINLHNWLLESKGKCAKI